MDGYAMHHTDSKGAFQEKPLQLKVIEDIPAGKVALKKIKKGEAARIMTGAVIPEGADSVIRQEDAKKRQDRHHLYLSKKRAEYLFCR